MLRTFFLALLVVSACKTEPDGSTVRPSHDAAMVIQAPRAQPAAPHEAEADATNAPAPASSSGAQPPEGWTGTGVLAKSSAELPKGAPEWAGIEAEVVDRDGKRFLLATGWVRGVDNQALARSAAEGRARAVLARWTGQSRLVGSMSAESWHDPRSGTSFARVEMELPAELLAPGGGATLQ